MKMRLFLGFNSVIILIMECYYLFYVFITLKKKILLLRLLKEFVKKLKKVWMKMKWKLFCKIILKHGNEIIFKDLIQYMKNI